MAGPGWFTGPGAYCGVNAGLCIFCQRDKVAQDLREDGVALQVFSKCPTPRLCMGWTNDGLYNYSHVCGERIVIWRSRDEFELDMGSS